MIIKNIALVGRDEEDSLRNLKEKCPSWNFVSVGWSKTYGGEHFHIRSKNRDEKGVLELTFPEGQEAILLKIADNRKTKWSLGALAKIQRFQNEGVSK